MTTRNDSGLRLSELDALRGLAAVSVLLYHLTSVWWGGDRGTAWYRDHETAMSILSTGHYGVELFFIISGFVIFMTLERASSVWEFAISRFARLYPAYWCAIAITVAAAYALESHPPFPAHIVVNLSMTQSFFLLPRVDGPYWTLAVEIEFYAGVGLIFAAGLLRHIDVVCIAWLAFAGMLQAVLSACGVDTSIWGTADLARYGFMSYGGLFIVGICLFRLRSRHASWSTRVTLCLAILYSARFGPNPVYPAGPFQYFLLTCALTLVVWLAVNGHAQFLRLPLFLFLGSISYPLYLIHQRIGLDLIEASHRHGVPSLLAFACVILLIVGLAATIHVWVEVPGRRHIRRIMAGDSHTTSRALRPDLTA